MFATYNCLIRTALLSFLMVFFSFSLTHAGNQLGLYKEINGAVCNEVGECALDISSAAKHILLACETPKVEVAWNRAKKNVFLIACDCECTSHDNNGWLVDEDASTGKREIWKLDLGKRYTVEELSGSVINVPDIFQSNPLCSEPDKELLKTSIFVSLIKYPTKNESTPYCFAPIYITGENNRLNFKGYDAGGEPSVVQYRESDKSPFYTDILNAVDNIIN
jgi:hypothetical protein